MTHNEQTAVEAIKAVIDKRLIRTAERIGGSELTVSYNTLEVAEAIVALLEASPTVPVSRWIPVTERLPKVNELVLCWTANKRMGSYHWQTGDDELVTHWQPLPEAPQ